MTIRGSQRRKDYRRKNAAEAVANRGQLTDQQQLGRLDSMFGKGQGAQRERARLAKRIAEAGQKTATKEEKVKKAAKKTK